MPDKTHTGGVSLPTLQAVMTYCNRWFERNVVTGDFTIAGGSLNGLENTLKPGQYYRIRGSVFSDGLHRYGDANDILTDETFSGAVSALAPPLEFLALASDVDEWRTRFETVSLSPYTGETFKNHYSYQKTSGASKDGGGCGWEAMFRTRLAKWRKL